MKTYEKILEEVLRKIEEAKEKNENFVVLMKYEISDKDAKRIENYLLSHPSYSVMARKCSRCKQAWDFTIQILKTPS